MNIFNFERVERILVLGAHPDDEIIGPGGTIHRFSRKGKKVYVNYRSPILIEGVKNQGGR